MHRPPYVIAQERVNFQAFMNTESVRAHCLSFPHATENVQWGNDLVFKIAGKMFAVMVFGTAGEIRAVVQVHRRKVQRADTNRMESIQRLTWPGTNGRRWNDSMC